MRFFYFFPVLFMITAAAAQTPGYHLIIGNPDGSPFYVTPGDTVGIPVFGATPEEGSPDSIYFMHVNLATDDSIITQRLGCTVPETSPLYGWDDVSFTSPIPNTPDSGYTSQSVLAFANISGPPNQLFWSDGDTVLLFYFTMITSDNPDLMDSTVCPFIGAGYFNAITPIVNAGCVHFIDEITHDVGVTAVISPPDTTNIYGRHPITIEVTNYGTFLESFDLICEIYAADSSEILFSDTIAADNVVPASVDTVNGSKTFTIYTIPHFPYPHYYEYDIVAYSLLEGDENPDNDTTFESTVFIREFFLIIGDQAGSPIDVNIGSVAEIPIWGGTPPDNDIDSIYFVHIPIASDDSIISFRYPSIEYDPQDTLPVHSYFPDTLIGLWDERYFVNSRPDEYIPDWTVQSLLGFADISGGPNEYLCTLGDTVLLATSVMRTIFDPGLMGDTLFAFQQGFEATNGPLFWGLPDGLTTVFPIEFYGPIRFMTPDELGYVTGTVTDPNGSPADGTDVSLIDAFRDDTTDLSGEYYLQWITPGTYTMEFYHPDYGTATVNDINILAGDTAIVDFQFGIGGCEYLPGDANGNDNTNGLDVIYLVAFFKGGSAPPDQCDCPPHGIIYAAADANGSCATNGLDVTYMVSYFKGGSPITYCPDCPPQE